MKKIKYSLYLLLIFFSLGICSQNIQIKGKVTDVYGEVIPFAAVGIVKKNIGNDVELLTSKTDDMRSYHISSNKIFKELSFENKYDIKDAVIDLKIAFEKNLFTDPLNNIEYFNIKKMQNIKLK